MVTPLGGRKALREFGAKGARGKNDDSSDLSSAVDYLLRTAQS